MEKALNLVNETNLLKLGENTLGDIAHIFKNQFPRKKKLVIAGRNICQWVEELFAEGRVLAQ